MKHFISIFILFISITSGATPKVLDFFYTPKDGHEPFIREIESAQKEIQLAMYHLSSAPALEALKSAAKRGVHIQILTDGKSLAKNPKYKGIAEDLMTYGIEIKGSTKKFSLMHEKALVADQKKILITNINLTSKFAITRDYGVSFDDSDMIKEFLTVFQTDWKNADNNGRETPPLTNPYLIWSPNNAKAHLIKLLNSAHKSVIANVESLGDAEFLAALANTAESGVDVRILTPICNMGNEPAFNYPALKMIIAKGVQVQVMPIPSDEEHPYIHAKMIVVDNEQFYIGSQNFSFNSLNYAREVGVILKDPSTAQKINTVFEKDWSVSNPIPKENPTSCTPYPVPQPQMGQLEGYFDSAMRYLMPN